MKQKQVHYQTLVLYKRDKTKIRRKINFLPV
jgi:hypothetical protein